MKTYKPNIVVIGGIETGKTSTIQSLWENNVVNYQFENNIHYFSISENFEGRGFVDFDVLELPRINYTSNDWVRKRCVRECLENADVILYILTCDEVSINSRRVYMETLFDNIELKKEVVFLIGYGMADWILFPESARKFEIPENFDVQLSSVTSMLKKISLVHSEFASFLKFDRTFSVASIVPYSNVVGWNIEELKHQIWNGVIVGLNELTFDKEIPTVVLSGKTGCGKTSTINSLWNKNLSTNRVVSCTKFPAVIRIEDEYKGKKIIFNLVDLPGIAESVEADSLYRHFYYKYINRASLLLCLTQADRRAYKQDQLFYRELISNGILRGHQKIVLGINQADLLFKSAEHLDGVDLNTIADNDEILVEKINDLYDNVFADVFNDFDNVTKNSICIYSVYQKWHLDALKHMLYDLIF